MAVLPLRHLPDPVLRRKAKRIRTIDAALQKLIDDMIETMHAENGVGLAANQVGVLQRVVVIQLPDDEQATVLINPEIIRREGEVEVREGCLSIPGYRGDIKRSVTVRVKALDRGGKPFRVKGQELLAEALEHETDHLNGILYIDHITDPESFHKMNSQDASEEDQQANTASG